MRSSLKGIKTTANPSHTNVIKCGYLLPGDCIRNDQFECRIKERLPNTNGREIPKTMRCGGTIFVDHTSERISILNQVSLGSTYTIRSKDLYELEASEVGVKYILTEGIMEFINPQHFKMSSRGDTIR